MGLGGRRGHDGANGLRSSACSWRCTTEPPQETGVTRQARVWLADGFGVGRGHGQVRETVAEQGRGT